MPDLRPFGLAVIAGLLFSGCSGSDSDGDGGDTVSGRIEIESRTRIDTDTADDIYYGAAVGNTDEPQSLPSPALTGGYLSNGAGSYSPDQPAAPVTDFYQDQVDRYRLGLSEDQTVTLQAFSVSGASDRGTPVARVSLNGGAPGTLSPGQPVTLTTNTGDSVDDLALRAVSGGPMRYVISVSSPASASALSLTYPDTDWLPDEALVTMASPAPISSLSSGLMAGASKQALGNGLWHVHRSRAASQSTAANGVNDRKQATLDWIRSLKNAPGVISAEPNYLYHALAVNASSDPLYSYQQWHYQAINLPTAWQALANPGESVRVAVLDTGVFSRTPASGGNWHPDLESNLLILAQSDFVTDNDDSQSGPDGNPANPGTTAGMPASFHGTHVAGTIAALDNDIGGVGVAPLATLLPIRVLNSSGSGSSLELINAIDYLASLPESQRPDIINLSLGGVAPSSGLEAAINNASGQGILFVAAAGNQGTSEQVYPAAFDRVIAVGAVDGGNQRASYSSFGRWLDLVAPGGDSTRDGNSDGQADAVYSAWGQQTGNVFEPAYAGVTGTSMAAPHVSGVLALMRERNHDLTLEMFREFLRRGEITDAVGNTTEYGYGLINALKSVEAATSAGMLGTFISTYPSAFRFDGSVTRASVLLEKVPNGSSKDVLSGVTVSDSPPWLAVEQNFDSGSLRLDARITDSEAAKQTAITVEYSNESGRQSLTLPVNVQLGDPLEARDAGRHYVLLIDQDDKEAEPIQTVTEPSNGLYTFTLEDVPDGEYQLVAGTDMDNNGIICEPGEACAEYPTNGLPQTIVKRGDSLSGLTLTTSFRRPALSTSSLPRPGFKGYRLRQSTATDVGKKVTR